MTYEDALIYLQNAETYGINLGLMRIEALLRALNNPEQRYKTIHVGGTNGKGSVTSMIASAIGDAGLDVGKYISPHLENYTERISISGQDISREDFGRCIGKVKLATDDIISVGVEHPTQFEILTAAAFLYFAEKNVVYAVIEVGLGGLLDSTNVITPVVSVITNIAMDHMAQCGNTLEAIATHKAGIIKPGIPVVTAAQKEALSVIKTTAAEKDVALYTWGEQFEITTRQVVERGQLLTLRRDDAADAMLFITLRGAHQAVNAGVAAMAITCVMAQDNRIAEDNLREGLARTVWPGRFEVLPGTVPIIIDGAHNPAGIETFGATWNETFPTKNRIFVFSILADKDISLVEKELFRASDVVFCVPAPTPRTSDPNVLAKNLSKTCLAYGVSTISEGLDRAMTVAKDGDAICIVGSLYIQGEARQWLRAKGLLP